MQLQLVDGDTARQLLADVTFVRPWRDLFDRCPWATAFQSPEFATAWYITYQADFHPLLIVGLDANEQIAGLMFLAIATASGDIVHVGAHHAEYQVWLCPKENAHEFPSAAFEELRRQFPSTLLRLHYLPPGVPMEWASDPQFSGATLFEMEHRPFMELGDGSAANESLKKPGNKSRLRQLRKLGPVSFERLTDPAQFPALLHWMAQCHDLRQLAANDVTPFANDPLKEPFHLALLNHPDLLHVTVMRVGDHIASAHINIVRGKEAQLYLIAHDPALARLSPGKLHMLFLARMLAGEGFVRLDLTPGGEAYKERFADGGDQVGTLSIFPSVTARMIAQAASGLKTLARWACDSAGVSFDSAKRFGRRMLRRARRPAWVDLPPLPGGAAVAPSISTNAARSPRGTKRRQSASIRSEADQRLLPLER